MVNGKNWGKRPQPKDASAAPTLDEFVSGGGGVSRFHCILPADLHKRVKAGCATEGVTMTDVIVDLLESRFPKR